MVEARDFLFSLESRMVLASTQSGPISMRIRRLEYEADTSPHRHVM